MAAAIWSILACSIQNRLKPPGSMISWKITGSSNPLASNYSAAVINGDWYTHGGFSKIHPGVTRNVEMSAARDDVKPFIRSYFNTMFPVLSNETLAFWEHIGFGDWNGVFEAGNFLRRTRMMFVMERGK